MELSKLGVIFREKACLKIITKDLHVTSAEICAKILGNPDFSPFSWKNRCLRSLISCFSITFCKMRNPGGMLKKINSKQYAKLIPITSSAMFSITRSADLIRKLPDISFSDRGTTENISGVLLVAPAVTLKIKKHFWRSSSSTKAFTFWLEADKLNLQLDCHHKPIW